MALGIGTGAAIFSVADAVALRGVPFEGGDAIVAVVERDTRAADTAGGGLTSAPTFLDWRRLQVPFEHLAATRSVSFRTRSPMGEAVEVTAQAVTWEFFPVLRVAPFVGRVLAPGDEAAGRSRIVVLGHAYWRQQFGGAPDVVGKTIVLNDEAWQIAGVAPPGFTYPVGTASPTDLYVPLVFDPIEQSRNAGHAYFYAAIGRLKPGVTVEQADRRMASLASSLDREHPGWSPGRTAQVVTLAERVVGRARPWMLLLLSTVSLVLLVACINLTGLVLLRTAARRQDLAVRAALGASRRQIVLLPLGEALVLALGGAAAGLVLARAEVGLLRAWLPFGLPRVADVSIDWRTALVALAAAVATAVVCGLIAGVMATRDTGRVSLSAAGRSTTGAAGRGRLINGLVVVELALTTLLLVGAGLFGRSFAELMRVDPGFDPHGIVALAFGASADPRSPARPAVRAGDAIERAIAAVGRVPGVQLAGSVAGGLPLSGRWSRSSVELPGRGELPGADDIDVRRVSTDYLRVLRVPLLRGRGLADGDQASAQLVALVNDVAARKYWPGTDPVGQRVTIADRERVVVGVVGNIRHHGPEAAPRPEAYLPMAQERVQSATIVARTTRPAADVLPALKAAVRSVSPDQRFASDVTTLDGYLDRLIGQRRFLMALSAVLGLLALVIAVTGAYAAMSFAVARRTSEIGVRMALGATPGITLLAILRQASALVGGGLALGAAAAWGLSSSVRAFLFGVQPNDPTTFAAALAVVAVAGLLAAMVPARRAASIDPLAAIRHE